MTVKVSPNIDPTQLTHHVSISAPGEVPIGLIYKDPNRAMERIPVSPPPQEFSEGQSSWTGGRGRRKLRDDPFGFWDSRSFWSMTDQNGFAVPQWRFATNFRTAVGNMQLTQVQWKPMYGANKYLRWKPAAIANATTLILLCRMRGNAQNPPACTAANTVIHSLAPDFVSFYYVISFTTPQTFTGTEYLTIYDSGSPSEADHIEIATSYEYFYPQISADGVVWADEPDDQTPCFRLTQADGVSATVSRRLWFFEHENAMYCISVNSDKSVSSLWINGNRGKLSASSAVGATTVTDANFGVDTSWAADIYADAWIRFIDGTGAFQRAYRITANTTGGVMTITPALEQAVDNTTRYVIYSTPRFSQITVPGDSTGLSASVTCRPVSANKVVYFCQGIGINVKRMHEDTTATGNHGWADTLAAFRYDGFEIHPAPQMGLKIWGAKYDDSLLYSATAPAWGGTASFTPIKGQGQVGSTDSKITKLKSEGTRMFVGKEDGLWVIDETTPKQFTIGALKNWKQPTSCIAITAPDENTVYFGYGNSLGKLSGTQFSDLLNFRAGYEGLPSDRKGYVSEIITVGGWTFFAIDAGTTGYSGVYAWNGMGIHEIFRAWKTGTRIRDIFWQSCPGTRGKLWIDAGGEPIYMDFPLDHANPLLDTTLVHAHEFVLVTGVIDVDKEEFYKLIHEVQVLSTNLRRHSTRPNIIELDYQINGDITEYYTDLSGEADVLYGYPRWTRWGEINESPFDASTLDIGNIQKIRFRFRGYSVGWADENDQYTAGNRIYQAVINGFRCNGRVAAPPKFMWLGSFRVGGNPPRNLKNESDLTASKKLEKLIEYATKQTRLYMNATRAEDDNRYVTISIPADTVESVGKNTWSGVVQIKFMEC